MKRTKEKWMKEKCEDCKNNLLDFEKYSDIERYIGVCHDCLSIREYGMNVAERQNQFNKKQQEKMKDDAIEKPKQGQSALSNFK